MITRAGIAGSVLVVDRDVASHDDCLLVAHLSADEPAENAAVVCDRYIEDICARRCRCRRLTEQDTSALPQATLSSSPHDLACSPSAAAPTDSLGRTYRLEHVSTGMSIPALRWCRRDRGQQGSQPVPVSLRSAIACHESYEPLCALTRQALLLHAQDPQISTTILGSELVRVQESPIVLNRRLREVVLATLESQTLSMSEIAIRCGRIKRDCKGNESGETSWLSRRLGLLAESGQGMPTPWIHSDVLALIARQGLGVSPREVEL